jgi:hypothetical protein
VTAAAKFGTFEPMRRALWTLTCCALLGAAGEAACAEPPQASESRFYGMPTLVSDAVSLVAMGIGFAASTRGEPDFDEAATAVPFWIGASGFLVAGPTVHVIGGHWDRALVTLVMRFTVPIVVFIMVIAVWPERPIPTWGGALGLLGGCAIATGMDAGVFAREAPPH